MRLSGQLFYGALPSSAIPESRPLATEEADLVRWLLRHGTDQAGRFLPEVDGLRVVARCECGCASIDFVDSGEGFDVLSDYQWEDEAGRLFGAFVFAKGGRLAGLEVWSIDGQAAPTSLPDPSQLVPLDGAP